MGACREITISYDYTFPGGTVNLTGESVYTHYTTLWYTWKKDVPKPSLFTTTLTNKGLQCCQQSTCCAQYNSKKSQFQFPTTCLRKKQSEESNKIESQELSYSWFPAKLLPLLLCCRTPETFAYWLVMQS